MKLVLELLGPPRLMGARRTFALRAGSLSVGRSPEADWTIPDTDRTISRLHMRIDASHGAFVLTDTSVNGVYVSGSDEPVGYGASVGLRDGDRLRIGEAQIAVTVEATPARPVAATVASSPFSLDAQAFAADLSGPAERDPLGGPFAAPVDEKSPVARLVVGADWMNGSAVAPRRDPPARAIVQPMSGDGPAARPDAPDIASQRSSVSALVEAHPGLSARRLAAVLDAAGQSIDPQSWRVLHQRIKSTVDDDAY